MGIFGRAPTVVPTPPPRRSAFAGLGAASPLRARGSCRVFTVTDQSDASYAAALKVTNTASFNRVGRYITQLCFLKANLMAMVLRVP